MEISPSAGRGSLLEDRCSGSRDPHARLSLVPAAYGRLAQRGRERQSRQTAEAMSFALAPWSVPHVECKNTRSWRTVASWRHGTGEKSEKDDSGAIRTTASSSL